MTDTGTRGQAWSHWAQELGIAARSLLRRKLFTGFAVAIIALAIAIATLAYSIVDALLLPRLPFARQEELVRARIVMQRSNYAQVWNAYELIAKGGRTFEPAATAGNQDYPKIVAVEGAAYDVRVVNVSRNYFDVLEVKAAHGRLFSENSDDQSPTAVIADTFWRRLQRDGRSFAPFTVAIGDKRFRVVGVLPPRGALPDNVEIFFPDERPTYCCGGALLRLRNGATAQMAAAELNVVAKQIDQQNLGYYFQVSPAVRARPNDLQLPAVLMVAAAALLLIACANVANLLLARGMARGREIAIRQALGASRFAVIRWLCLETSWVALTGGAIGIVLSVWGAAVLSSVIPPTVAIFGAIEPQLSWRVVATAVALSFVAALSLGLFPAIVLSRTDAANLLRGGGTHFKPITRLVRFHAFAALQIAGAISLLVVASLMTASAQFIRTLDIGYRREGLIAAYVQSGDRGPVSHEVLSQATALLERIRKEHFVQNAALMWGGDGTEATVLSTAELTPEDPGGYSRPVHVGSLAVRWVTPGTISTLGARLVRGRDLLPGELGVVLGEQLARKLWPHSDPLGLAIRINTGRAPGVETPWLRVVGIMEEIKLAVPDCDNSPCETLTLFAGLTEAANPIGPFAQFVVRATEQPELLTVRLRVSLADASPDRLSFTRSWGDEAALSPLLEAHTFLAVLFAGFAVVGLTLAVLGVYAATAQMTEQRLREFGVRLALGARRDDILSIVLRDGLLTAVTGLGIGLIAAVGATRFVERFLFGLGAQSPVHMAVSLVVLFAAAVAAGFGPALRAARTNPVDTLRAE